MVFFESNIGTGVAPKNTVLSDFGIVSIKSNTKLIIFKVNQDNKIVYFHYYPRNVTELYIYTEIFNGSPLWSITEWTSAFGHYVPEYDGANGYYFTLKVKINADSSLIKDFLNSSLAINSTITENFEKMQMFEKMDFSEKSFVSLEESVSPPSNFKLKLYDYQKKSLAKMIKMEKGEINFKVKYTLPMTINDIEIIYDPISNRTVNDDKFLDISVNGGVLSDEMGLGKTITSLALIMTNKTPNDAPAVKFSEKYQMNKLFSKATLVLCPSHLTKQWETEALKCNPKFVILNIVTKKDMDKLNVNDIQNADLIITSHQFLMNLKFYPSLHYKVFTATTYDFEDRKRCLKEKLASLLKNQEELLTSTAPIFEFFYFQRMIIDEGHEIFGEMLGTGTLSRYMSQWVTSIDSNYFWYISGTPFINFIGVKNCSKYINLKLSENERQLTFDYSTKEALMYRNGVFELFTFLNKAYIWDNILNKICIRHRKIDVLNQIEIPGYEEKLVWVKFTNLERQLYDAKKGKAPTSYLQQLCCHPMVIESSKKIFGDVEVNLELMQDKLIEYHQTNFLSYKSKLEKLDKTKTEYHMLKKTFESNMNESKYIFTILTQMKNKKIDENEKCAICLDELDNPTLTACGHLFCYDCLKMCLGDKKMCPMCKANLAGKELLVTNKKVDPNDDNVNPLIQKYGSKLGKTISIIRSLVAQPKSRIIIFSQWDDMLTLIGKTLSENGIENSFVKGNVWSRNSAINKFKAGKNTEGEDNKVIMLSLKNSASGTNLTEATHIIFIEPINSSKEECRAIEGQAIGRACRVGQKNKISLIRILVEKSIEEEIYRNVYNKDVIVEIKNDSSKEIEL